MLRTRSSTFRIFIAGLKRFVCSLRSWGKDGLALSRNALATTRKTRQDASLREILDVFRVHLPVPNRAANPHSRTFRQNITMRSTGMSTRVFASVVLLLMVTMVSAPWLQSEADQGVPHFNAVPPAAGSTLPPILTKDELWGDNAQFPYQTHAYELAAKIPTVIYQQPCYCYCDRGMEHNSLHSFFSRTHGAQCGTGLTELYYTYTMHKQRNNAR